MVELTYLEQFTKGDTAKIKRYINLYLDVTDQTFDKLYTLLKNQDWEQVRIHAHSLKPQAELIGIQHLKEVLIEIEQMVFENKYDSIKSLVDKAFSIHIKSTPILESYLKSIT